MTKEQLAEQLNGCEYPLAVNPEVIKAAKQSGLVIAYGQSDDLIEFEGAIYDEAGVGENTVVHLTRTGLPNNRCDDADCPYFISTLEKMSRIKTIWSQGDYSWQYETVIPHATFDILEDGDKYCRGIVFNLSDVAEV